MTFAAFDNLSTTALAFRGYNVTNLGRSAELLAVDAYREIVVAELERFSAICSEYTAAPVNLLRRIEDRSEPQLPEYAEAVALVVAMEVAQMRLLAELHHVDAARAKCSFGYSLGELVAVSFGGVFAIDEMVRVPLALAADSAALAADVTMGVLFSRAAKIEQSHIEKLCLQVTAEGKGTIGISAVLSPNTYLLIGQRDTVKRFKELMHDVLPLRAHLRLNDHHWPPLHTPIVRQRQIADRAAVLMDTLPGGLDSPCPPVLSLVTGSLSYNDYSARSILRDWVDHPQRLWDAVDKTLAMGIETVVHVGPEPNVIPATYARLSENVAEQISGSLSLRAVSGMARRPWLAAILPARSTLLRAPDVRHVILEDWLLENAPSSS